MSKLLLEQRGAVTLLTLNRPAVHNDVDAEFACLLADPIVDFGADGARPTPPRPPRLTPES